MFNKAAIVGLFSLLMIFSFIPTSQAELWELVVELNVENGNINSGETVVISGKVVDHAYKPIRGAEVLIRTGSDTTRAFTDIDGTFKGEFKDFERIPGKYIVNVIASWYGMTGLTSTDFQVKGNVSSVSLLQEKLSTDQAIKYLSAKESDFEKDPIGQTLFKYYQGLHEELVLEKKDKMIPLAEQALLEEQRKIAEELKKQGIEEFEPGAGTYEGYRYDDYISGLNPEIRDLVVSQLDFTKNKFVEAQKIKDEILANGGTYEEARQAYLDMLSIPKETLEQFNQEKLAEEAEVSEDQTEEDSESQ